MTISPMPTGKMNGCAPDTGAANNANGARSRHDWMTEGSCHGKTDVFFAPHAERPQARARREAQARVICASCPSLDPCRNYARMHREYGFWGGESEEDRARAGFSVPWPIGVNRRRGNLAATG